MQCEGRLTSPLFTRLTRKISLLFILTFTAVIVIDSTITNFYIYSDVVVPTSSNVIIFTLFFLIFASLDFFLLYSVKKNILNQFKKIAVSLGHFYLISFAVQISMIGIILAIILQMAFLNKYDLLLLQSSTILTHASALVSLIIIVALFIRWFRSRKNYTTVLYLVSFSLISISVIYPLFILNSNSPSQIL